MELRLPLCPKSLPPAPLPSPPPWPDTSSIPPIELTVLAVDSLRPSGYRDEPVVEE